MFAILQPGTNIHIYPRGHLRQSFSSLFPSLRLQLGSVGGGAAAMNGAPWLQAQNAKRAQDRRARGAPCRVTRRGAGHTLAKAAWVLRRSLERRVATRRLHVVGRVRLKGKGPLPRFGPLPERSSRLRELAAASPLPSLAPVDVAPLASAPDLAVDAAPSPEPMGAHMLELLGASLREAQLQRDVVDFRRLAEPVRTKDMERLAWRSVPLSWR